MEDLDAIVPDRPVFLMNRDVRGAWVDSKACWAQRRPQMDELTIPFLDRDPSERQFPLGDLLRAGVALAMGSDWAVTTANPPEEIEVAVTRVEPENREDAPLPPEQALPLQIALQAFTHGSAHVNHDDAGTIAVGKRADLAALDRNILDRHSGLPASARATHTVACGASSTNVAKRGLS